MTPRSALAVVLIIIYRYHNNLFHGVKWEYLLAGQLDNFNHANNVLMKLIERYGGLH
jgi:hypothetical protein